jgi:hypothetical protein
MNQTLAATCEQTVSVLTAALSMHGYHVERSFDLRSALQGHDDCPCPYHGTTRCTCQYMVLLVYEADTQAPPALITVHECDGATRLHVESNRHGGALPLALTLAIDETLNSVSVDA